MKNDATFVRMRSVITLETQKCRKRAPRSVEFNFFNNCDRHKRFSQTERRRADLQNVASDFLIFALGLGPAKKSSQNPILKLIGMLAISQFKARFQARKHF